MWALEYFLFVESLSSVIFKTDMHTGFHFRLLYCTTDLLASTVNMYYATVSVDQELGHSLGVSSAQESQGCYGSVIGL